MGKSKQFLEQQYDKEGGEKTLSESRQMEPSGSKMDDESSSLKLKLYLFSYFNTDQWQDQRQLPVEEKKDGSSTGLSQESLCQEYKSSQVQRAHGEVQAVPRAAVWQRRWRKNPVQIKTDGTERFRTPWNYFGEEHLPEEQVSTRMRQSIVPEET